jgi:pilus assembly protein CpaB
MNIARVAALGVTVLAGGVAFLLMSNGPKPSAPAVIEVVKAAPPVEMDAVLVATRDIGFGAVLNEPDMTWQEWPKGKVPPGMVRKSEKPNAIADLKGAVIRGNFSANEPFRQEKIIKGANAGFMSAMLSQGSRAVAINIDSQGATTAGGFILPNDRVDIIRTYRDEEAAKSGSGEVFASETILSNVRVLAIGQNVEERKNGEKVVVGSNATLELDPRQAELIVLAQRIGQLSLVLRAMVDSAKPGEAAATNQSEPNSAERSMTIVRFGVPSQARGK